MPVPFSMLQKIKNHWNDWLVVLILIGTDITVLKSSIYYYLSLLFITLIAVDRSMYTFVRPPSLNYYPALDLCFCATAVAAVAFFADDNKYVYYVYMVIIYHLFLLFAERGIFLRTELFKSLAYRILVKSDNPGSFIETKNIVKSVLPWPIQNFLNPRIDHVKPRSCFNLCYILPLLVVLMVASIAFVFNCFSPELNFTQCVAYSYSALIGSICFLSSLRSPRNFMNRYLDELRTSFGFALVLSLVTALYGLFIVSNSLFNLEEASYIKVLVVTSAGIVIILRSVRTFFITFYDVVAIAINMNIKLNKYNRKEDSL